MRLTTYILVISVTISAYSCSTVSTISKSNGAVTVYSLIKSGKFGCKMIDEHKYEDIKLLTDKLELSSEFEIKDMDKTVNGKYKTILEVYKTKNPKIFKILLTLYRITDGKEKLIDSNISFSDTDRLFSVNRYYYPGDDYIMETALMSSRLNQELLHP